MPLFRVLGCLLVTAVLYPPLEAGNLLLTPWPRRRSAWRSWIMRSWGRGLCRCLKVRTEVRGPRPRQPYLLVSNHLSYLDIPLLASVTGAVFVSRADVRGWPWLGRICHVMGVVFLDRDSKRHLLQAREGIEGAFAEGRGVVLFPEGTTGDGRGLLPFRPALLAVAARSGRPVHRVVVRYATPPDAPPAEEAVCWGDDTPLKLHARRLLRLPSIAATVSFGAEAVEDADRKRLARRLHAAMAEEFQAVG